MGIARSLDISASGLSVERVRMDVIANNLANINTTRVDGVPHNPYRRKHVIIEAEDSGTFASVLGRVGAGSPGGVRVAAIEPDTTDFKRVKDPGNPDADADGWVLMPNVEPVMEMVDLITAQRAYDANVTALNAAKTMQSRALQIGSSQ